MAFAIGNVRMEVQDKTRVVTVPNHPVAKLMYYLDCVCDALQIDRPDSEDIEELRNYQNYQYLSEQQRTELMVLCTMLSPDVLLDKVFFQNDEMCGELGNKFYEIGMISNKILVSSSIVIGGQTRNIKCIMAFQMSWLRNNYVEPMQTMTRQLEEAEENQRKRESQARKRNKSSCVIL